MVYFRKEGVLIFLAGFSCASLIVANCGCKAKRQPSPSSQPESRSRLDSITESEISMVISNWYLQQSISIHILNLNHGLGVEYSRSASPRALLNSQRIAVSSLLNRGGDEGDFDDALKDWASSQVAAANDLRSALGKSPAVTDPSGDWKAILQLQEEDFAEIEAKWPRR